MKADCCCCQAKPDFTARAPKKKDSRSTKMPFSALPWADFAIGFVLGYGVCVVMVSLVLGRQMKRLPWLWEDEVERQRHRHAAATLSEN
ncbi:hypothetical protein XA68_10670 [Ophiocordyceps unilateralis]|uniref:Uncharacterized protein n=1 Tax=Ophiocordyceps unilateralis TaxID=268505 RepID=A0A2A9P2N2_OPHUN|nr:hypothetical protein XA68_10670 [Ophiocordyceps unilateralis]